MKAENKWSKLLIYFLGWFILVTLILVVFGGYLLTGRQLVLLTKDQIFGVVVLMFVFHFLDFYVRAMKKVRQ